MYRWSDYYKEMISRNIGIITEEEQEILKNSTVAIAGSGGMGGLSALWLCQIGIGGLKIADFDKFEISNINRQFYACQSTLGKNKSEAIGSLLLDMNPELNLEIYNKGVIKDNVEEFVSGTNAVIDGIDYTNLEASLNLHHSARMNNLYVFYAVAIGFGANLFIFAPDGMTLEEYIGFNGNDDLKSYKIPIEKFCPVIPSYVDPKIVQKAATGEIIIPNIGLAQAIGTGMMAGEVILRILDKRRPVIIPKYISFDVLDYRFNI